MGESLAKLAGRAEDGSQSKTLTAAPPAPADILATLQTKLLEMGEEAVEALRPSQVGKDDGPSIRAAEAILDRIGLPRESKVTQAAAAIPQAELAALLGGLAAMFGRSLPEGAILKALERDVTPAKRAGQVSKAKPIAIAPEDARRARRTATASASKGKAKRGASPANIPSEVLAEMEGEGEDE